MCWVPCLVWVCGSVAIIWTLLVCRLRARYGGCYQPGSMSIVALWLDSLCMCGRYRWSVMVLWGVCRVKIQGMRGSFLSMMCWLGVPMRRAL